MIVLCLNCGWLGTDKELGAMPIKSDKFQAIIEANNMYMSACPRCKETEICCKKEYIDNLYSNVPVAVDRTPAQTLTGTVDTAELIAGIEEVTEKYIEPEQDFNTGIDEILNVAKAPTAQIDADGKIRIPRAKSKKQICDICKKEFDTVVETSRCDECYEKLMKRLEENEENEKSKDKKKIAKKRAKTNRKQMKTKKKKKE